MIIVAKAWGYEQWFHNSRLYCYKHLHIEQGKFCSLHYHEDKSETFVVLSGEVQIWVNGKLSRHVTGDSVTIHPYEAHQFRGVVDSVIAEASTHHKDSDSIRITREWQTESTQRLPQLA